MPATSKLRSWIRDLVIRAVGIPPEWQEFVFGRRMSGEVSPTSALQCTSLIASIRLLSNTIASLNLGVFRNVPEGKMPAPLHLVHPLIAWAPNRRQTSVEWRRDMVTRMLIYGHSYDQILMNVKREVLGLVPLHPRCVDIEDAEDPLDVRYKLTGKDGVARVIPSDEILHIPYLFEGESLFEHAKKSIGLAISAEQFAQQFFTSGGLQQLKLETDQVVGADKKREIVESLHKNMREGKIPFTDAGTKLHAMQVKFEEVQLKDTRMFQLRDIARVIGPPPHMIGDLERSTNNNIENQGKEFQIFTIMPLARSIEQRLNMSLFGPREGAQYFAEFDLTELSRADFESTCDGVGRAVAAGVMTPNEGRRILGLNDHPEGGRLLIQGAMVPIAQVGATKGNNDANQGTP